MPPPILLFASFGELGRLDSLTQKGGRWDACVFWTQTPFCAVGILKVHTSARLTDICGFLNQLLYI